jgi:hypothetical protein
MRLSIIFSIFIFSYSAYATPFKPRGGSAYFCGTRGSSNNEVVSANGHAAAPEVFGRVDGKFEGMDLSKINDKVSDNNIDLEKCEHHDINETPYYWHGITQYEADAIEVEPGRIK